MSVFHSSEKNALRSSLESLSRLSDEDLSDHVNVSSLELKNQKVHLRVFGNDKNIMSCSNSSEECALRIPVEELSSDLKVTVLPLASVNVEVGGRVLLVSVTDVTESQDELASSDVSVVDEEEDLLSELPIQFTKTKLNPRAKAFTPKPVLNPNALEFIPASVDDNIGFMDLDEESYSIPRYTGSETIETVADLWDSLSPGDRETLGDYGYPKYFLEKIKSCRMAGTPINPFSRNARRPVFEKSVRQSAGRVGVSHERFHSGEVAKVWIIPHTASTQVVKPQLYSPRTFKNWVYGKAAALWKTCTRKNQVVTANDSCRCLFFSGGQTMSSRVANQLFATADVYVVDFSSVDKTPRPLTLGESFGVKSEEKWSFSFGTHTVTNLEEVIALQEFFKRDKPLFRVLVDYYSGGVVDPSLLQASLIKHFPIVQGQGLIQAIREILPCPVRIRVEPVSVTHTIDWNPFSGTNVGNDSLVRGFVQVTSLIVSIFQSTDWKGVLACVTGFAASSPTVWDFGKRMLSDLVQSVTIRQGLADTILAMVSESLNSLWETIVGCSVLTIISECSSSLAEKIYPMITDLIKETRRAIMKESAVSMAKGLATWISDIFGRFKEAYDTKSMDPLWGQKWNPQLWAQHSRSMVTYYALLTVQASTSPDAPKEIADLVLGRVLPNYWVNPVPMVEYISRCESHLDQLGPLCLYFSGNRDVVNDLKRAECDLRSHVDRLKLAHATSGERVAPFFAMFYGPPGVGKTNLARAVAAACGRINHFPTSNNATYDWQPGANFQDGLNHCTTVIIMDDVDQGVAPPSAGVPNHIESVIAIANNKPYPVEQARVELKGTIFASPAILMLCSNYPTARVEKNSLAPHAFMRRIGVYVTVIVKPEFALPDGRLDPAKAGASETHDMFILEVQHYRPNTEDSTIYLGNKTIMDFPSFMKYYNGLYKDHAARELSNLKRRAGECSFCPECGLSMDRGCGHQVFQIQKLQAGVDESNAYYQGPDPEPEVHRQAAGEDDPFFPTRKNCTLSAVVLAYMHLHGANASTPMRLRCLQNTVEMYLRHGLCLLSREVLYDFAQRNGSLVLTFHRHLSEMPDHLMQVDDFAPVILVPQPLRSACFGNNEMYFVNGYVPTEFFTRRLTFRGVAQEWGDKVLLATGAIVLVTSAMIYLSRRVSKVLQGREGNVTGGTVPMNWQRADQTFTPGLVTQNFGTATFTLEQVREDVKKCSVQLWRKNSDGVFAFNMYGSILGHSLVVTPTHFANLGEEIQVRIKDVILPFTPSMFNRRLFPSNPELCALVVPSLPAVPNLFKKVWLVDDSMIQNFDGMIIMGQDGDKYTPSKSGLVKKAGITTIFSDAVTVDGDCGLIYVAKHNDVYKVVGMHYATMINMGVFGQSRNSLAGLLCQREISALAKDMATTSQGVVHVPTTMTQYPKDLEIGRFGVKSEVWAAKSHHGVDFFPIGEMTPPLPGSSMKSKIRLSIIHDELASLEEEFCGRERYWTIPNFRGEMINDKWTSSYTEMFAAQNRGKPQLQCLWLALYDYLNGLHLLDGSGYLPLTEHQTIVGIPGSGINSVNMKTSAGPPLKGGKKSHIVIDEFGPLLSPEYCVIRDSIESVMQEGEIPSTLAICSLKDEPLKYTKRFSRVFNNMASGYNLMLKETMAPLKLFMRSNWKFFESLVGINMTSDQCNDVVSFLKMIDPTLTQLYDMDATKMDKSWSGQLYEIVALAFYAIARHIGVNPARVYTQVHSLKHTTYSVKNDLIQVFHNPSGNDITVELNGIAMSIGERYVYYRTNPVHVHWEKVLEFQKRFFDDPTVDDDDCSFRDNMALVTYGDDNVKSTRVPLADNYEQIWKDEIGIEMLDAAKTAHVVKKTLSEISLLKRKFVTLEGVDGFVAALDIKTLARMVRLKRDSTLGDVDHAAVVCSEFLREAVYHGRTFYDKHVLLFNELAVKKGFLQNPYYVVKTFDERIEEVKGGSFQTWSNRDPVSRPEVLAEMPVASEIFFQSMSNVQVVKVPESGAFDLSSTTQVVHNTGAIDSENTVMSTSTNTPSYYQSTPATNLGDFLTRATHIWSLDLATTDPTGTSIQYFDPWYSFLNNPQIIEKLANFTYIRGTLQIMFVPTCPPMSYGAYALSAIPRGSNTIGDGVSETLRFPNMLQTDHNAILDCANNNTIVFQLPWVSDRDFLDIRGTDMSGPEFMWRLECFCLHPITSTTPGGGVPVGRVQVYVNLLDDYVVSVPHFQGKHKLIANDAMKHYAPEVHAMIGEGKGSKLAGKVAQLAEAATSLPIIGPFAQTAGAVARLAETGLGWLGFTVEQNERAPMVTTMRSTSSVAHTEGEDSGWSASLSLTSEISIDPTLAGFASEDCLANADLFKRWTLVYSMAWTPLREFGDILGYHPVTPSFGIGSPFNISLTTAGYVGLPFNYWRGDMEYMIVIPLSKVHKGKLQIAWVPNGSVMLDDPTNVTLNTIFDVSTGSNTMVTIGFTRDLPYLENRLCYAGIPIDPIGAANGNLVYRVVNPLMSPSETASTIVYVFARAKGNMQFAVPRDEILYTNIDDDPFLYNIESRIELQGAVGDEDTTLAVKNVVVVPESMSYPGSEILFGETVGSVRDLLQKPSRLNTMSVTNRTYLTSPVPHPGSTSASTSGYNVWTWQGHYATMFYGLAFSERFKVFPKEDAWVGVSRYNRTSTVTSSVGVPTLAPLTFTGPQKGAEFRVPYYRNKKFVRTFISDANTSLGPVTQLTAFNSDGTAVPVMVYYSFGADIRATCFRQIPLVAFKTSTSASYKSYW